MGTVPEGKTETVPVEEGDPDAGKVVFTEEAQPPCGSCHTYEAAGTTAMVGPDLDEALQGQDAQEILEAIIDPDADIAEGFAGGVMPKDYGQKLSEKQLADLVAFLLPQS